MQLLYPESSLRGCQSTYYHQAFAESFDKISFVESQNAPQVHQIAADRGSPRPFEAI